METLGNTSLLSLRKIGYFASSKIASLSVLPTLDWATEIAKREDVAIVSGFHSRTEREVLEFLLNGKCGIICVLARSIFKRCPEIYRKAFDANRVLFISPINTTSYRSSRDTCQQRNEYIASISDQLVFSSLTTESSLYPIAAFHPDSIKL